MLMNVIMTTFALIVDICNDDWIRLWVYACMRLFGVSCQLMLSIADVGWFSSLVLFEFSLSMILHSIRTVRPEDYLVTALQPSNTMDWSHQCWTILKSMMISIHHTALSCWNWQSEFNASFLKLPTYKCYQSKCSQCNFICFVQWVTR